MKYKSDKGAHAIYSIQFHLVFCVKYRKKVLCGKIAERLREITVRIAEQFDIEIIEQNTDMDHIHIVFSSKPQIQASKFVNSLKGVSSRLLRKEFPELKKMLWSNSFWSQSYFIASAGEVGLDVLKKYVEEQGYEQEDTKNQEKE